MTKRRSRRTRSTRRKPLRLLSGLLIPAILVVAGFMLTSGQPEWNLPGVPGEDRDVRWALVATDELNVREGPSTAAPVLDRLPNGASVEVIGSAEAGFVPVTFGEGRAWLAEDFLSFDESTRSVSINPLPVRDALAAVDPVVAAEPERESTGPEPIAPPVAAVPDEPWEPAERWIDIDRSAATVTLYDGDVSIASFSGRIGRDPSADGFYATAVGTFHVYSLNKGLAPTPFAEDTWLTDWVGFDPERKNGIHSPVRDADGVEKAWQNPSTMGCVRLNAAAAEAVFEFAEIGMRVEVHE